MISELLFKFVPSLFLPTNVWHVPPGVGVGEGEGGAGPEHRVGSGPCTTVPMILRLDMLNEDPSKLPGPPPQSSGGGTQELVHCDEYITAPALSCVDLTVSAKPPSGDGLNPPNV